MENLPCFLPQKTKEGFDYDFYGKSVEGLNSRKEIRSRNKEDNRRIFTVIKSWKKNSLYI